MVFWYRLNPDHSVTPEPVNEEDIPSREYLDSYHKERVGRDEINDFIVSTIFLGFDHGFPGHDKGPILFETMIFENEISIDQERYNTYEDAVVGHAYYVGKLKEEAAAMKDPEFSLEEIEAGKKLVDEDGSD